MGPLFCLEGRKAAGSTAFDPHSERIPNSRYAGRGREAAGAGHARLFGEPGVRPIGAYVFDKRLRGDQVRAIEVRVFAMEVLVERLAFPERGQREKAWISLEDAAERVDEPDLKALVRAFKPPRP